MSDEPRVVPPRNDLKKQPIFVKASIADQAGAKPGHVRQWASKDPLHPQYYGRYLDHRQVGDADIGYCQAEPWTVVQRKDAKQGRKRDDDTSGIETAQTHGDLVLIETTEENAAIDREYDRLKRKRAAEVREGVQTANRDGAHMSAVMLTGERYSANDAMTQVRGT